MVSFKIDLFLKLGKREHRLPPPVVSNAPVFGGFKINFPGLLNFEFHICKNAITYSMHILDGEKIEGGKSQKGLGTCIGCLVQTFRKYGEITAARQHR